ncbi:YHYH protein [Archangium violaceum]|uniref:YHYH protein n=1 Tax=Archangium violaceum TaxID=83451 RepID=UPI001950B505|nr:YHYH protein [Archangium violaceum]QRN93328.1 YHYH protein [Archangium violaceum]
MLELTIKKLQLEFAAVVLALPLVCCAGSSLGAGGAEHISADTKVEKFTDITNQKLQKRSANCTEYVGTYVSSAKDVRRGARFKGSLTIAEAQYKCVFETNSIPNHNFNDGNQEFANQVKKVTEVFEITTRPRVEPRNTPLSINYDNGILLNGVKLDLLAAACYCVGDEPLGEEKIGCLSMDRPWRYDPMSPINQFGADEHNAHAQPDGAYHYHGNPHALFNEEPDEVTEESPVIGFAADGFPIYGPYIKDGGEIREVRSSYRLKEGKRKHLQNEACFPGGDYDGRFRDDWEYDEDSGDLDECNGMDRNGKYGYYVTNTYPWVMACFRGIPDGSFRKMELHAH